MQPAPATRAPALAWLTAHAHTRNRFLAVLAYPVAFVVVLMSVARRGVYQSDHRNGMVILARWRPALEGLLLVGIMLLDGMVLCLISGLLWLVDPRLGPAVLAVAGVWIGAGAVTLAQGQQAATPISTQTPTTGERWQVAALAQRPGTRLSALLPTRQLIADVVPPGDVLVAAAGTEQLEQAYMRAGFTPVGRRRLYRVA